MDRYSSLRWRAAGRSPTASRRTSFQPLGEEGGGLGFELGGEDDLEETVRGGDDLGAGEIDRAVDREDAAVRGERVALDRERSGPGGRFGEGEAAGVGVLDDAGADASVVDFSERFDEFEGGGGVEEVVVGEVLAGELVGVDDGGAAGGGVAVQDGGLVRVFSVSEFVDEPRSRG